MNPKHKEFIKETYLYLLTQGQKHRVCKAGFHQQRGDNSNGQV